MKQVYPTLLPVPSEQNAAIKNVRTHADEA